MSASVKNPSPLIGVVHSRARKAGVYWAAAGVLLFAAFLSVPVIHEIRDRLSEEGSGVTPRWVYVVLLQCLLLVAYALLAVQAPDWSTLAALAVAALTITVAYAMALGATIGASADNRLVQWLELAQHTPSRQAARWCFAVVCLGMMLTYLGGRLAARWRWEES